MTSLGESGEQSRAYSHGIPCHGGEYSNFSLGVQKLATSLPFFPQGESRNCSSIPVNLICEDLKLECVFSCSIWVLWVEYHDYPERVSNLAQGGKPGTPVTAIYTSLMFINQISYKKVLSG